MPKKSLAAGGLAAPGRGIHVSINGLAGEIRSTHETITKRLTEASVQPSGQKRGFPVYRLGDVWRAMTGQTPEGVRDPEKLLPFERHAHYKAEREKIDFERELGLLIPATDLERVLAHVFKCVSRNYDTLPDILERDGALTAAALAVVERRLDAARRELRAAITEGLNDSDAVAGHNGIDDSEHVGDAGTAASGETE